MDRCFPGCWYGGWKLNKYHSRKSEFPPFVYHVSQDVIDCFHSDYLLNLFGRGYSGKSGARMLACRISDLEAQDSGK
jgi:hypothetical protein